MRSTEDPANFLLSGSRQFHPNDDGLASLEYAVKFLGVPLVMVLGHSNCGAIAAAIEVVEDNAELPGHLPGLVQSIKPAVEAAESEVAPRSSRGRDH
ncbi:carbonic anhydrase [Pseudomonas sp. GG8]